MSNHISTVRQHLLDTLADLRDPANAMSVDRARAIGQIASVLVDTARVEVDYLKATGQASTPFLEVPPDQIAGPATTQHPGNIQGIASITRHRLLG